MSLFRTAAEAMGLLPSSKVLNEDGYLVDAQAEVERLRKMADELRDENTMLFADLIESQNRHTKASHHINKMVKEQDVLIDRCDGYEKLVGQLREEARNGNARVALQVKRLRLAYIDACRALAGALWGDDHEPMYDGEDIAGGWPGFAASRARDLRTQNVGLKAALTVFVPWFDEVLRTVKEDATIVKFIGAAPGSTHERILRRGDIRIVREILEQIR
jgi:hypothetical protein